MDPLRLAFLLIVALHGLLHLLGFVKGLGLAEVSKLSTEISRPGAVAWLVAALALLATAGTIPIRFPAWWLLAVSAALLSQALIVSAWTDAKFGTPANIVLLLASVASFAESRFTDATDREIEDVLAGADESQPERLEEHVLADLPIAVQTWLRRSGAAGQPRPKVVHLRQRGEIQLAPGGGFRPIEAHQYFTITPPAFVWRAKMRMFGLPIVGRDIYAEGRGHMLFLAAGIFAIVDESDARIAQGALLRYLGETVWFPGGAVAPFIDWAPGEDPTRQAIATMRFGGIEASATFTFDDEGRFVEMAADRYMGGGEEAVLTPWSVRAMQWATFEGVEVPSAGVVTWHLPDEDFVFYRWSIDEIRHDPSDLDPPL